MIISFIVAMSKNRVIGKDNKLPWNIPADLQRFKRITLGHPIIMGRKTFESMGKALPNRENIVVTRQKKYKAEGVTVCHSLEEALKPYKNSDQEVFIIGGGEIFQQALPLVNKIYLTVIDKEFDGDAFFPEVNFSKFKIKNQERILEPIPYSNIDYIRY